MKDMDCIELAHNLALKSTMKKRYGCVITYKGTVVGTGYNRAKNDIQLKYCIL